MRFLIVDDKDAVRDDATDLRRARSVAFSLANVNKGVKFYIYQQLTEFCVPSDEQKAEAKEQKEFWK